MRRSLWWVLAFVVCAGVASAQAIRFESGGLSYQTLTKNGLTIMYAHLPDQVREYVIVQVAVSNGSKTVSTIRAQEFAFSFPNGEQVRATPADTVVSMLLDKGSRNDVIRLVNTYEIGLYGLTRFRSTNGYEQRRQSAQAALAPPRITAAAAASAIAFVDVKLKPGESTDGALFFSVRGRPLAGSRLRAVTSGQVFEFDLEEDARQH